MIVNTQQKYKPKSLNEFIFSDKKLENTIKAYATGSQTRPLILYGTFGTGKSLLARLLPNAIENCVAQVNYLTENDLSSAANIRKVFSNINQFDTFCCQNNVFNYYIIEEINFNLTDKAISAFRQMIEVREGIDLIIMTSNAVNKIDTGIRSRSNELEVKPLQPVQFINRAEDILLKEGVKINRHMLQTVLDRSFAKMPGNRDYYKALDNLLSDFEFRSAAA